MCDYRIPKLNEINTAGITVKNGILTYNARPLRVQTGIVLCFTDEDKIRFQLSTTGFSKLEKIDDMINSLAESQGMNHIKSITDGWMNLAVNSSWTRFFDSNKAPVNLDSLTSEFTGSLLLDLSKITVFEGDRMKLSISVLQVLVRTCNQLPHGCEIFNDISALRMELTRRSEQHDEPVAYEAIKDDGSIEDDVNELLDS